METKIEGVRPTRLVAVQHMPNNELAIVFEYEGGRNIGIALSAEMAEEAASKLLFMLPPSQGAQIDLTVPEGAPAVSDIDQVEVHGPAERDDPYIVRFVSPSGTFELRLPHLEAIRWSRRLASDLAAHHQAIQN